MYYEMAVLPRRENSNQHAICNENNRFAEGLPSSLEFFLQFAAGIVKKYIATHPGQHRC
jgi:hypothetical protein